METEARVVERLLHTALLRVISDSLSLFLLCAPLVSGNSLDFIDERETEREGGSCAVEVIKGLEEKYLSRKEQR